MPSLGRTKLDIKTRLQERQSLQKIPKWADLFTNPIVQLVFSILHELGLDWNTHYRIAPPYATKWRREGVLQIAPGTTTCLSWKAKDKGIVCIDQFDLVLLDIIANEDVTLTHEFNGSPNDIDLSIVQKSEAGVWKFDGIILDDGDTYKVCIVNNNQYATAVVSIESKGWEI